MKFQIGSMSVGDIFDRGLRILLGRLGVIYLLGLMALAPMIVYVLVMPLLFSSGNLSVAGLLFLFAFLLVVILQQIASAAILRVIFEEYIDRRISLDQALNYAFGRFGALLGTSILSGIVVFLYSLLLLIPGIVCAMSYAFVAQVVVLEGLSGSAALDRSHRIALGYRWRIFGILLLLGIMHAVIVNGLGGVLQIVLPPYETVRTTLGAVPNINYFNYFMVNLVTQLLDVLVNAYLMVCITLTYFDLRARKEGFDLELAAQKAASPGN